MGLRWAAMIDSRTQRLPGADGLVQGRPSRAASQRAWVPVWVAQRCEGRETDAPCPPAHLDVARDPFLQNTCYQGVHRESLRTGLGGTERRPTSLPVVTSLQDLKAVWAQASLSRAVSGDHCPVRPEPTHRHALLHKRLRERGRAEPLGQCLWGRGTLVTLPPSLRGSPSPVR